MPLSHQDWHTRYLQQAVWTEEIRRYLYPRAGLPDSQRVLDLGCGSGALLSELHEHCRGAVVGLDIDRDYLEIARQVSPTTVLIQADAHTLPLPAASFDLTLCHFVLLWVADPIQVLREAARVTRLGGTVLALAEPDYGGRIDYPPELEQLGSWQRQSLERQGADPLTGRKLAGWFAQAGLVDIEAGILGSQWQVKQVSDQDQLERDVLVSDLKEWIPANKINQLLAAEAASRRQGERVLFVPTFYAWGRVPA